MDMVEFFSLLWPEGGHKFVVAFDGKFKHHAVKTPAEAAAKAAKLDAGGDSTVYFSCASYEKAVMVDAEGKRSWRTQDNAQAAKCFWQDLDVEAGSTKKYGSKSEAIEALEFFLHSTGLPRPMVVSSGGGYHVYWPLRDQIAKAEWITVAIALRRLMRHYGMKSDPSRDKDIASVLRPIDTHHRKDPTKPKLVRVVDEGDGESPNSTFIRRVIKAYGAIAGKNDKPLLPPAPAHLQPSSTDAAAFAAGISDSFPDASAVEVGKKCAQIEWFLKTGADSEPIWRACAGIVKHCVEGEAFFHEVSKLYDGYTYSEAQQKLNGWKLGPTTCETFADDGGRCSTCQHRGKIKSPIQLGSIEPTEPSIITVEEQIDDETVVTKIELPLPYFEQGDSIWQHGNDQSKGNNTKLFDIFFYPTHRVRQSDGTVCLEINARLRKNADGSWQWKTITVPTATIGAGGSELAKVLASYEIVTQRNTTKDVLAMYMKAWMDKLRLEVEETTAVTTFGWQNKDNFVLGDTAFMPDGSEKKVRLGGTLAVGYGKAFSVPPTGSAEEWGKIVGKMYNHPGHEQYQFVLAAAMASPLVELLGIEMGAPINLYGARGKGKTTVCQVGLSVWGDPKQMQISDPKDGTTSNALYARISTMHNVPILIDEVTKLNADELGALAYHICNAKPKDSLDQSRRRRDPIPPWYSLNFMTSNDSAQDKISSGKVDASAQLSRFMEIDWSGDVKTITPYEMNALLFKLEEHYGAVGPVLARYYIQHREELRELMLRTRERMDNRLKIGKENRFWSIQVAAVVTFLAVSKRIGGIFPFEPRPIVDWLVDQVTLNLAGLVDRISTMEDAVHSMITSLSNRTIATSTEITNSGARLDVRLNESPVARILLDKGVGYYDINHIRTWCASRYVNMHGMRRWLEEQGYMLDQNARYTLGRGTTMVTGQSRCWAIDYFKIMGIASDRDLPSYIKVVK